MSRFPSLYLEDPNWEGDPDDIEQSVVDEYPYAYGFLATAPELWRIAGHDDRAEAIDAICDKVCDEQEFPAFTSIEIDQLLSLIDGIEEAFIGKIVDEKNWSLSDEKLAELRKQKFKYIDMSDSDVHNGKSGIAEALGHINSLRNILLDAKRRGLNIGLPI